MKKSILALMLVGVASSSMAYDIEKMSWSEIKQQAKQEGEVTFSVWYLQPAWRKFVQSFEQETGIKVKIPEGTYDGNINKLRAEGSRDKGSMDVIALGAVSYNMFNYKQLLLPLNTLRDISSLKSESEGINTHGYGVTFWGNQTGLAYDSNRIKFAELPQTFAELENYIETNPMQFGVNDPNGGGAGARFIEAVIVNENGRPESEKVNNEVIKSWSKSWDWFKSYKDQILITASNADSLTRINDGEILIAPAWEDHLAGLQVKGALSKDIKFYIPKFGMSGGANLAGVVANSKRKAAAFVFIDWLTSAKTQSMLNKEFGTAPQHPEANADNALIPQDMRKYSTQPFYSDYQAEAKKEFTRNVLMSN
ncbi:ABC transporter substrate-binding protein [Vibrio sp. S12_S33]|uniref:ABC transporter substrate-binding protein n=1 Tax=Vibrio sp. S12_S33 TaxID=2720223 RepID=UPI0017852D30|nr:extracellular solute-binding protein [Vibrio sp. S12_S33]MBD1566329.1 extracellular solute-binding protein [Vibrio sp. S12_S33]